jgi:hypothetical protein
MREALSFFDVDPAKLGDGISSVNNH